MILGVDFGRKKTGTAFMDMDIKIPFPCTLYQKQCKKVKRALMDIIEEKKIDTVVFGLPYLMKEKKANGVLKIRRFSEFLLKSVKVNIVFVDEYGTSKEADFILRGKKKNVKKKANDLIAATLILENYLNVLNINKNQ